MDNEPPKIGENAASTPGSALVPAPPPLEVLPPEPPGIAGATPAGGAALGLSRTRLALAFAIAAVSDALSVFFAFVPPVAWTVDFVTALLLFVVLGWRWLILPGLILEAIPGVSVFPFWVLVVSAIALLGTPRPKLN